MNSSALVWDAGAVATGLDAIGRLRPTLLARLKALLDGFHGQPRPLEYYDLVAGMWLEGFMHNVYVAWREVLAGDVPCEVGPMPVMTSAGYAAGMLADAAWHRHLRGAVAALLEGRKADRWPVAGTRAAIRTGRGSQAVRKAVRALGASKPRVLLCQPYFKCPPRDWLASLWRWRGWAALDDLQYPVSVHADIDWEWRTRRSAEATRPADFETLATALLPLYVPLDVLEGFDAYRAAVLALPVARPQAVYSANALHGHPTFQILAAEWRNEGTRLLYHQHGGGYGVDPDLVVEKYEMRVSDCFYSWGWTRDRAAVRPLSPALPRPRRTGRSGHVLLNCLDLPRTAFRLGFAPLPGTIEDMHRNTGEFLHAFSDRSRLVVRPFPVDYGWGAFGAMRAAAPEARFDTRHRQFPLFFSSRLVVHNYLGTAWLETLGLDIPTVVFYDPGVYVYRDEAHAAREALHRVGILHRSGGDAARFVSELGRDIEGWWRRADVQAARRDFVRRYADFAPDWPRRWEQAFDAALDGAGR